jgi:TPR repeat protein
MMHHGTSPCDLAFQAEGGDPEAQYQLGVLFLLGDQVEQDPDAAYRWLAKAASSQHRGAQSLAAKVAPWRASVAPSEGSRHTREGKNLNTLSPLTLFRKLRTQAETVLERGRKILASIRSRQLAAGIGVPAGIRDSLSSVRRKAVQSLHPS